MSSESFRISTPSVTQADGEQILPVAGSYSLLQIHVEGGTSGTLAVQYQVGSQTFDLPDDVGNPLVIDLAANTGAFTFEGIIDSVVLTPTAVVGDYVAGLRGVS